MSKIRKELLLAVVILLIGGVINTNNVKATKDVTWIEVNTDYAYTSSAEYADYVYFTLPEAGRVNIDTGDYDYTSIYKLDDSYNEVAEYTYEENESDLRLSAGIYKTVANDIDGVIKRINYVAEGLDDLCEEEDNNIFENANIIETNQEYTGDFTVEKKGYSNKEDEDYYKFEISDKGSLYVTSQINLEPSSLSDPELQLYVLNSDGDYELIQEICEYGVSSYNTNKYRVAPGIYYIKLAYKYMGGYKLKVTYDNESNGYYESEKNDDIENATSSENNKTYTGNIADDKDVDFYKIDLMEASIVEIALKTNSRAIGLFTIEVFDEDQNLIGAVENSKSVVKISNKKLAEGTYYITVRSTDDKVDSFTDYQVSTKVEKYVAVKKIKVNGKKAVKKGKKIQLSAIVAPSNASVKDVTWKTSNSKIATVTKKGVVTGKKPGIVTITVVSKDNKKVIAKYKIKVTK